MTDDWRSLCEYLLLVTGQLNIDALVQAGTDTCRPVLATIILSCALFAAIFVILLIGAYEKTNRKYKGDVRGTL